MFFEDLKENYTKVSYKSVMAQKPVEKEVEKYHVPKKQYFYEALGIVGIAIIVFADPISTFASSGIEVKAKELYFGKFIGIAKWVLIGKGGWDTVNKTLKEDFEGAKKCFIQYLVAFCALLGLPTALDWVEGVFASV